MAQLTDGVVGVAQKEKQSKGWRVQDRYWGVLENTLLSSYLRTGRRSSHANHPTSRSREETRGIKIARDEPSPLSPPPPLTRRGKTRRPREQPPM